MAANSDRFIDRYVNNLNTFFTNIPTSKNSKNMYLLIGLITILFALWCVFYAIPALFAALFHTLLGNLILVLCAIFVSIFHTRTGIILFIIFIIIYQFSKYSGIEAKKEGFDKKGHEKGGIVNNSYSEKMNDWSDKTIKDFIGYIQLMFPNTQVNMGVIQRQATEEQARQLIDTKSWPWSQEAKSLYINALSRNQLVSVDPGEALKQTMKIYNENAGRQMLAYNTKEGKFLLNGIDLGPSAAEPLFIKDKKHDTIKCAAGPESVDQSFMEKTQYFGANYFSGLFKMKKEPIKNEDLPKEIKGFSFIKEPCNPCVALNSIPDYSCPFKLNVKGDDTVSNVWAKLWNIA